MLQSLFFDRTYARLKKYDGSFNSQTKRSRESKNIHRSLMVTNLQLRSA